eukprot:scaffold97024_cov26-Tisochrysis_lutea.AAC.2
MDVAAWAWGNFRLRALSCVGAPGCSPSPMSASVSKLPPSMTYMSRSPARTKLRTVRRICSRRSCGDVAGAAGLSAARARRLAWRAHLDGVPRVARAVVAAGLVPVPPLDERDDDDGHRRPTLVLRLADAT